MYSVKGRAVPACVAAALTLAFAVTVEDTAADVELADPRAWCPAAVGVAADASARRLIACRWWAGEFEPACAEIASDERSARVVADRILEDGL